MSKKAREEAEKIQARELANCQAFSRITELSDLQLQQLLMTFNPVLRLSIPPDFALDEVTTSPGYFFDFFSGEYKLRSADAMNEDERFVPIDLTSWLSLNVKTQVLTSHKLGKKRQLKNVEEFSYLGKDQVLAKWGKEHPYAGRIVLLDTDLNFFSSTKLTDKINTSFSVFYSDNHIAFYNIEKSLVWIFNRNFDQVGSFSEVFACAFLGENLLIIWNDGEKIIFETYDFSGDAKNWEEKFQLLEELGLSAWVICILNSEMFMVSSKMTRNSTIWRFFPSTRGFDKRQIIFDHYAVKALGERMFLSEGGDVWKNISLDEVNYMKIGEFGWQSYVELRYPSKETIREIAKSLETPLVLDLAEIIVGFCAEVILP